MKTAIIYEEKPAHKGIAGGSDQQLTRKWDCLSYNQQGTKCFPPLPMWTWKQILCSESLQIRSQCNLHLHFSLGRDSRAEDPATSNPWKLRFKNTCCWMARSTLIVYTENEGKFEDILGYIMSSRPPWTAEWGPVLTRNKTKHALFLLLILPWYVVTQ